MKFGVQDLPTAETQMMFCVIILLDQIHSNRILTHTEIPDEMVKENFKTVNRDYKYLVAVTSWYQLK